MSEVQPQIRCYLPLGVDLARQLQEQGSLAGEAVAFVVTQSVRGSDPAGDEEAWEYAALQDAAAYCQQEGIPVVIAAADVARDTIDDTAPTGSRVRVHGPVARSRIASLHLGDDVLGEAATGFVTGAGAGGAGIELSWYDATELADVVDLL